MALFETEAIKLSLMASDTGEPLTATVYTLEGVYNADGSYRKMSVGQLVMAICLERATKMEQVVVGYMESIAENTEKLNALAAVETVLVDETDSRDWYSQPLKEPNATVFIGDVSYTTTSDVLTALGISSAGTFAEVVSRVESSMDSLNTTSQETLIKLQSATSKRDDTYTLIANILKSINQVMQGITNNL